MFFLICYTVYDIRLQTKTLDQKVLFLAIKLSEWMSVMICHTVCAIRLQSETPDQEMFLAVRLSECMSNI